MNIRFAYVCKYKIKIIMRSIEHAHPLEAHVLTYWRTYVPSILESPQVTPLACFSCHMGWASQLQLMYDQIRTSCLQCDSSIL